MTTSRQDRDAERFLAGCYAFERERWRRVLRPDSARYTLPPHLAITSHPEATTKSVWLRLLGGCRAKDIDPVSYVVWGLHIDQCGLQAPPEPNQLLNPGRMKSYLAKRSQLQEFIGQKARRELDYAASRFYWWYGDGITVEGAWSTVLGERRSEITPLIRYRIARLLSAARLQKFADRFEKVAGRFEPAAMHQYQYHAEAYDRYLGRKWMPVGFAERATALYARLVSDALEGGQGGRR